MGFGWTEILLIFGIILLVFGPNKLPQLAKNLGSSINVFKEEVTKAQSSLEDSTPSEPIEEDASAEREESSEVDGSEPDTTNGDA